eukprot:6200672-Pleurochrysis_carterae.AAC.1
MSEHAKWFMGPRKALHHMRLESGRCDSIFEQVVRALRQIPGDKCGDESLYLPGGGRLMGSNQSLYTYRVSLQANFLSSSFWQLNFILPNLRTGANFGCTALLAGLVRSVELGSITSETRRLLRGSDVR